jgi:hypothetical protein
MYSGPLRLSDPSAQRACSEIRGNCIIATIGNSQVQSVVWVGTQQVLMGEMDGKKGGAKGVPMC